MNSFGENFPEPFTPRGVAAFARRKWNWLLSAQFLIGFIAAVSLTAFLNDNCFSVVHDAIQNLPDTGKISFGRLNWDGDQPKMLAEGKLLAIDVDLDHSGAIHSIADARVEFGRDSVRIYCMLPDYLEIFYKSYWTPPFNRTDLDPLWNAWLAEIIFITGAAAFLAVLLIWNLLATLYFLPVWLMGFFVNRDLDLRSSWKLSAAAVLPGALLMIAGLWFYDFGFLNLVSFAAIFAAHFLLGWIYLAVALIFLPRASAATPKGNPFQTGK